MQMQQVRAGRAAQVPVPPASAAPLEISREMRQHLRLTRHSAFERHQENAQWTKEILDCGTSRNDVSRTPSGLTSSLEELQKHIEIKKHAADELERQLVQQQETQQATQRRFEEMLNALKTIGDAATLKNCEEKLEAEKKLLLPSEQRKMEIIRL
ncbi:uncharacterized protein PITG_13078 [Phytophthora infestans T30-4]|uniref:Uncharacterized protein n=1 Tax=Phytophthora infestans (strain T30-4) TaxID=403677 RepID=D0NK89_PHYIT|nr:uncharacterized protein PITG_13078 [Phytophthora infestans T30-4]EEY59926.1 conserved hypothetical protein [Phytophthora infestans T30-4]KAI9981344.1 hypothetical protein PInf_009040 [Phytophthora infestans]|eukprot:XP_002900611.1 conserved hypothetical protein [Phytophthora infestans T30-4]